ncbi:hypothetical protein PCIT_a2959 [Pseudoalteromonas citrea]|uniref:Uncharacterized protein n=1 Tax=Pseudoalteromonas citrea TaxID=43655 RepID=A0AAD4FRL7_9GAMM|nr:hypothetical protein PCIT_a2959 [Pseudoalteromonas citrea]
MTHRYGTVCLTVLFSARFKLHKYDACHSGVFDHSICIKYEWMCVITKSALFK